MTFSQKTFNAKEVTMATILRKKGEQRPEKTTPTAIATIGHKTQAEIKKYRQPTATETFRALNALFTSSPRTLQKAPASC